MEINCMGGKLIDLQMEIQSTKRINPVQLNQINHEKVFHNRLRVIAGLSGRRAFCPANTHQAGTGREPWGVQCPW